ncbi:MAG: hypothetical protein ACLFRD_08935 [Nitriliruptoraceae bacterium]
MISVVFVALAPDEAEALRMRADLAFRGVEAEVHHARTGSYELEGETLREHVGASERGI